MKNADDFEIGNVIINTHTKEKYVVIGINNKEDSSSCSYDRNIELAEFDIIEDYCDLIKPFKLSDELCQTIPLRGIDIKSTLEHWELATDEVPFKFLPSDSYIAIRKKKVVTYI